MDFEIVAYVDNYSCLTQWFSEEEILQIMKHHSNNGYVLLCDDKYSYVSEHFLDTAF